MTQARQRRLLQVAVGLACVVPLLAGGAGVIWGAAAFGDPHAPAAADSHVRYLSGLLLGIGLVFASSVPRIERHTGRFRLLTSLVVIGGLARLYAALAIGSPGGAMLFGLAMELVVTPLLCVWQTVVARGTVGPACAAGPAVSGSVHREAGRHAVDVAPAEAQLGQVAVAHRGQFAHQLPALRALGGAALHGVADTGEQGAEPAVGRRAGRPAHG